MALNALDVRALVMENKWPSWAGPVLPWVLALVGAIFAYGSLVSKQDQQAKDLVVSENRMEAFQVQQAEIGRSLDSVANTLSLLSQRFENHIDRGKETREDLTSRISTLERSFNSWLLANNNTENRLQRIEEKLDSRLPAKGTPPWPKQQ